MTEADVAEIESALGYSLPKHYRQFILQYGRELQDIKSALPLRTVPYINPDEMIQDNEFARTGDVFRVGEDQRPWPENYLLIATNGGGDFWLVHRDESDLGVWFWSHESCEIQRVNTSLGEYMEELRRDLQDPDQWQFNS